jgi:hypothetical protein
MLVRITIFLLLASVTAFAQGSVSEQAFKQALDEELAKRENGTWLYARSEVYRKTVLHHIAEKLYLGTANQSGLSHMQPQSAQLFSGDVSTDPFGQEETSIAISRNDPNRIVIGSNDEPEDIRSMPVFLSTDAGMSWNTSRMPMPPKPYYAYGDPFVIADQYNGFYYAFLIYNEQLGLSNIIVAHSTDGVLWTFGNPVIAGKKSSPTSEDKESIAIDLGTNSPVNGRIYVSWMHFDNDNPSKDGLQLAWSDNACLSWSSPVQIDSGTGFFSQVKVDNSGNVFYTYSHYTGNNGIAEHYLLISYDNGATFVRQKIADYFSYPYSTREYAPTLKGINGIRGFPYIAIDYDARLNILHAVYGTYKKWDDNTSTAVLYYTKTTDGGSNWSKPLAVGFEGDSSALHTDRFMPWIGVDENSGDVHLLYYSSEEDPNNIKLEAYRMVIHREGKISYTRLSDSLFDPLHVTDYTYLPFIGDYNGCALQGETFAYAWTENRKGLPPEQYLDGEVYAYVSSASSGVSSIHQISARSLSIFSAYPNPSVNGSLKLGFAVPQSGTASLSLSATSGSFCKKLFSADLASGTYEKEFDISAVASGNYVISLKSGNASVQKKIIVVH